MSMRALDINFVQSRHRVSYGVAVLFALAACISVGIWWSYYQIQNELKEISAQDRYLLLTSKKGGKSIGSVQAVSADVLAASTKAFAQLQQPWGPVMDEVARVTRHQGIAMLSMDAEGGSRIVRISAHAKDFVHVLAFLQELKQSPWLASATLIGHEIDPKVMGPGVRFSAELSWKAAL